MSGETTRPCPFCEIVAGRSRASILHRDEQVVAFMNLNQATPGMVIVIPTLHVTRLHDLHDSAVAGRVLIVAGAVARAIESAFGLADINLVLNTGAAAGQEVAHLHAHVVPRRSDDGFSWTWPQRRPGRETLDRIATRLAVDLHVPQPAEVSPQELVRGFIERHGLRRDVPTMALDLASEAGEVAKEALKGTDYGDRPFATTESLSGELGDALYSALALIDAADLDAETLLRDTLARYAERIRARGNHDSGR